jgi:ElaB/YqjD/DUF883 family membrane-anchored ribosome-binding protein
MIQDLKASSETVSEAWEDGREALERFLEETRDRAQDLIHQATRQIKRKPLASFGLALGIGVILGVLLSSSRRR